MGQHNLKRRAHKQQRDRPVSMPSSSLQQKIQPRKTQKIGTPGDKVVKQRDPETGQLSLLFRIDYPEIEKDLQPRHRFMSSYEQNVEIMDKNFQYLLFAAEPYDTIAFKIPNEAIDKGEGKGKLITNWDKEKLCFTLQLYFEKQEQTYKKAPSSPGLDS